MNNKVAVITGGAQGIGLAVARHLAGKGLRVVVADLQEKAGVAVQAQAAKDGLALRFLKVDLTSEREIRDLVENVIGGEKRIDLVVNSARPKLKVGPLGETLDEWDLALNVLLKAPALLSNAAFPHLAKSRGAIVNIVSTNGYFLSHQAAAYHVAKAGLVQLTRYLAGEYGPAGVRVNGVCPALVDVQDRVPVTNDPVNRAVSKMAIPLQRACRPEEIAEAIMFLASEKSGYITGQVLMIDGGLSLYDQFHAARLGYKKGAEGQAQEKAGTQP